MISHKFYRIALATDEHGQGGGGEGKVRHGQGDQVGGCFYEVQSTDHGGFTLGLFEEEVKHSQVI